MTVRQQMVGHHFRLVGRLQIRTKKRKCRRVSEHHGHLVIVPCEVSLEEDVLAGEATVKVVVQVLKMR